MANTFKSWGSLGYKVQLSLFVVGSMLSACVLDPAATQNSSSSTAGGLTASVTTSTTQSGTTSQAQATSSGQSSTSGSGSASGSGPKADCIGVNPEADPEEGGFSAYQDTGTTAETTTETTTGTATDSVSTSSDESSTDSSTDSTSTSSESTSSETATDSASTSTDSASGSTDSGSEDSSTGEGGCVHPACIGDPSVSWQLHDHQPMSCGFGQDYGQDAYYGKTTMVVFLAGWCNFCLRQTVGLEKMRIQWAREGKDINILIVNAASANNIEYRSEIVNRTSNPVFQDTAFADVWGAMAGIKDTFYIYDAKGILREYLVPGGAVNIDLSDEQGYAEIKRRAESVLAGQW